MSLWNIVQLLVIGRKMIRVARLSIEAARLIGGVVRLRSTSQKRIRIINLVRLTPYTRGGQ